MRAAKVQASLRILAVSPEPSLLAHTSSESRGTFRQKARSLAPLNGWACAVKNCHDGMLEDTNSLDAVQLCSNLFWTTVVNSCFLFWTTPIWATWENLFMPYANNKGANQPAHPRNLISAFIVHCLDSTIPLLVIAEISRPQLVSEAEQAGLSLTWSKTTDRSSRIFRYFKTCLVFRTTIVYFICH